LPWDQIHTDKGLDYKEYHETIGMHYRGVKTYKFRASQKFRCHGYREKDSFVVIGFETDHKLSDRGITDGLNKSFKRTVLARIVEVGRTCPSVGRSAKWLYEKYFRHPMPKTWWFHAKSYTAENNLVLLKLFILAQVKIERHVKIKAEATPYHSAYELNFAQRRKRSSKWSEEWHPCWL
jgi:hypothetical protein